MGAWSLPPDRRLGVAQGWLWFVGMAIFSHYKRNVGLLGYHNNCEILLVELRPN